MKKLLFSTLVIVVFCTGCAGFGDPVEKELEQESKEALYKMGELATVTHITDGDTFTVKMESGKEEKVRTTLINTPEICHQSSPSNCESEPYGDEATVFAEETLLGKKVILEQDVSERDQYGRMLFYVYLEDSGQSYQEMILGEGLAKVAVYEPDTKYQETFEFVENEAKEEKVGMWK